MNVPSSMKNHHHHFYSSSGIKVYRNKNHQTNFNLNLFKYPTGTGDHTSSSSLFTNLIAAGNLDKTPTTGRIRRIRRRNHLRKKLEEEEVLTTTSLENESSSCIVLNPNQLETQPATVLPLNNNKYHHVVDVNPPNLMQHQKLNLWAGGISCCALLVFIAFRKQTQNNDNSLTSLDKEMLRRKLKARITKHQNPSSHNHNTSSVEFIPNLHPPEMIPPQLDMNTILNSDFHAEIQPHTSSSLIDTQPQPHLTTDANGNSHVSMPENDKQKPPPPAAAAGGRIITSVKEARQYLHNKKLIPIPFHSSGDNVNVSNKNANVNAKVGEKWMEDEFQPIVDKIRGGFSNNYKLAKQKLKEDVDDIVSDLKMLQHHQTETELEWMKDDKLTEIVFQVRENELMGRHPFYLMDHQDKALFFKGLENKVEKENEKLRLLHEYLHSNIENLDYGADGISLYDPPEKIIPRWKGPPPATTMSLDDYIHQRKSLFAETFGNSDLIKTHPQDSLHKTGESKNLKGSKTVIEGSDGSVKPGKKSGKEFWHHTKKWSRGFIDSYNAENDPETKAVMKDIGKDLDRWITEKEIQATADIMDKVPDKGKKFIAEKINKLKTEMELFGPQAVVSKYSEYGEEEEIDYYWWLDLPFVLCIELYIDGGEGDRIGFYSLEMASDLELDPKPHHIIAFEDAGDCKNFCYIIQAHMEMLGNGNAFVVPQLPKDTYQEAKTNGFNVTVIRKGELKLDVDQTLEEVEEKLVEIGSKMYHDKIMKGRNVDVDSVMKGVFGLKKPPKRSRSTKKLKKPIK